MRAIDPLLPEPAPLPEPGPAEALLAVDGAQGLARSVRRDPAELAATWGPLDQRWLFAQVTGPEAMARLLARWRDQLAGEPPPGPDSAAVLPWPSRDVAMTTAFLRHGLYPDSVIAVRLPGRLGAAAADGVRVRRAGAADLAAVVALYLEQVRFGAQVGGITERASTAALVSDTYTAALAVDEPRVWVADAGGELVGLVSVAVGAQVAWVASMVAAAPIAYVDCMSVSAAHRGAGVGTALVGHMHASLDRDGITATLLHYGALNPLSAPFWHRSGYRPLSTRWQLIPAR